MLLISIEKLLTACIIIFYVFNLAIILILKFQFIVKMSEKFFFVFIFELFITDSFFIAGIVFLIILDTAIFT